MKSRIITKLSVSPLQPKSKSFWRRLVEPTNWQVQAHFMASVGGTLIEIKPGRIIDFASVPRILKPIFPDSALYGEESAIHDELYRTGECSRWMADAFFYELLSERQPWITAVTMWIGVRIGGWFAWRNHIRAGHHAEAKGKRWT